MNFLAYIVALVVAVGSVLVGLDVISSLPQHKSPAQHAGTTNKLARYEAARRAENTEGDRSRPLAPLYPDSPGAKKDVRVVYPPTKQPAETDGSGAAEERDAEQVREPKVQQKAETAQPQQAQPAPQPKQQSSSAPASQSAKLPEAHEQQKLAHAEAPQALPAQGHCDVSACSRAYSSFRAADCTYQPFEGPRRTCTAPPRSRWTEREQPARDTVRARTTETRRKLEERPAAYHGYAVLDSDDPELGSDDDPPGPRDGDRRVIILDQNYYRPWD